MPENAKERRTVLITGASSGIGRAVAETLSGQGMRCLITGRREDVLHKLAAKLGAGTMAFAADLRREASIHELFAWAGKIDALVNAAGVAPHAPIVDGAAEDWRELLEVNVLALAMCCQHALRCFDSERGGQIVNISSMSGHRVPPTGGFYAATKFAVRAISEALRGELRARGSSTRVTCISPGFVDTPLVERYFKGRESQLESLRKEMRFLRPADIAASVWHVLEAPAHVEFGDILLRPTDQAN